MALTPVCMCEVVTVIRAGGDIDGVRKGVEVVLQELVLQALIEAEATEVIGARRCERAET